MKRKIEEGLEEMYGDMECEPFKELFFSKSALL